MIAAAVGIILLTSPLWTWLILGVLADRHGDMADRVGVALFPNYTTALGANPTESEA